MAVDRPTFHESWYRIAEMRPRLMSGAGVHRQFFRGRMWYVLENPTNNQYSRISPEAYRLVGLLDGKRTVSEVWSLCNEQLGDRAPTQGEVIQLLGQLYSTNMLYAELPPDTESLFNRYSTRMQRQVQGFITNLLFIRIPLLDPDHFLGRWLNVFGRIFTWYGFILWLAGLAVGLYFIIGNAGELWQRSSGILAGENLLWLYLSFALIKVFHEFGHSFACKRFGRYNGNGGQVHTMGVMFLVFAPVPYMDASSAWAFRRKWHRVVVGSAGMMVELFCASIAAAIWANTSPGLLNSICYNVIFVAGVSSLLFNGNPLLRFDAYYILADVLEIPNLSQRSKDYLYYLVKKYCFGVRKALSSAYTTGERIWFVFFGIASTTYRIYICYRILLFLNNRLPDELFLLVPMIAIVAGAMWVLWPIIKFVRYLADNLELARVRGRAVAVTVGFVGGLVVLLGVIPAPDYCRVEGVVEPVDMKMVHAESAGWVEGFLPTGRETSPQSAPLIISQNPELVSRKTTLLAEREVLEVQYRLLERQGLTGKQAILAEQIAALNDKIERIDYELAALKIKAPQAGVWIAPDIEHTRGAYLQRGQTVGLVADLNDLHIRATANQEEAAVLIEEARDELELRVKGRPYRTLNGRIEKIIPAGQDILPSEALGYLAGGDIATQLQDPRGNRTAERFFEVRIRPELDEGDVLFSGQRVVARIKLPNRPLVIQWYRYFRQLFQRRFHI